MSDYGLTDVFVDYRQNRRIRELQEGVAAAQARAATESRVLRSQLAQVRGGRLRAGAAELERLARDLAERVRHPLPPYLTVRLRDQTLRIQRDGTVPLDDAYAAFDRKYARGPQRERLWLAGAAVGIVAMAGFGFGLGLVGVAGIALLIGGVAGWYKARNARKDLATTAMYERTGITKEATAVATAFADLAAAHRGREADAEADRAAIAEALAAPF